MLFATLGYMEVEFSPDLQARLAHRAAQQGLQPDEVVREVVARYFEEEDRFIEAARRGEAALDRGDVLTHEQVGKNSRLGYRQNRNRNQEDSAG
jgi:predicted transcriptional regulator